MIKNLRFKNSNFEKGFTLVELIIYMGLLSGFLLILTSLFTAILDTRISTQAVSSVEQDGRFILSRLAFDINRASSILVPNAQSLVLTINGQSYTYSVNSSKLQLASPAGTDLLDGSGTTINNLNIQRVANLGGWEETFRIQFNLSSVAQRQAGSEVRDFQTAIGRRIR
jgi:type II secretory pathway pseudopilin PulG